MCKIHSLAGKIFFKNLRHVFPRNLTGGIPCRGATFYAPPRGIVFGVKVQAVVIIIPLLLRPPLPSLLFPRRKLQSPEAGRNAIKR